MFRRAKKEIVLWRSHIMFDEIDDMSHEMKYFVHVYVIYRCSIDVRFLLIDVFVYSKEKTCTVAIANNNNDKIHPR